MTMEQTMSDFCDIKSKKPLTETTVIAHGILYLFILIYIMPYDILKQRNSMNRRGSLT